MRCLVTFGVTTMALLFEKACRKENIPAKIVPVPRSISASCGLACEYPCGDEAAVRSLCERKKIAVSAFTALEDDWTEKGTQNTI